VQFLGEVVAQVLAFSSGLLVLATIGIGVYMRVSRRDPFTGKAMPQRRSNLQWLFMLFLSLALFTSFVFRLVPDGFNIVRFGLLAAEILFTALFILFFLRFLLVWRDESRHAR
jgi:hypothetical protein